METRKWTTGAIRPVIHLMVMSFLFSMAFITVYPFMVEIFLAAICPGRTECSQLMIMMGAQQVVSGLGTVLLAPLLGSASDDYGRKPILMLIMFTSIVPAVIMAYSKTKVAVYLYFVFGTVVSILRDGGLAPTLLAYVADVVDESQRAACVGVTMSSMSFGMLTGTMCSYLIKTAFEGYLFAAILQISAAVYLMVFIRESNPRRLRPAEQSEGTTKLLLKPMWSRQTSKLQETAGTIWNSRRLRVIALVDFTSYLVLTGSLQSFAMFFVKSVFNFGKDQYATLSLIYSVGVAFGQMLAYPALTYLCGDRAVLWVGLLGVSAHFFIYGFAWSPSVPFVANAIGAFASFIAPSLGTMASKEIGNEQQGKVQGFLSGIKSTASIISPLIFTPLTATALGDDPPFNIRGFPLLVGGGGALVAFLIALRLPPSEKTVDPTAYIEAPAAPEDLIHPDGNTA